MSGEGEGSLIAAISAGQAALQTQGMKVVGVALGNSAAREILDELGVFMVGRVNTAASLKVFRGLPVMASDFGPRCALLVDVRVGE